jgi:hypothetical protein
MGLQGTLYANTLTEPGCMEWALRVPHSSYSTQVLQAGMPPWEPHHQDIIRGHHNISY